MGFMDFINHSINLIVLPYVPTLMVHMLSCVVGAGCPKTPINKTKRLEKIEITKKKLEEEKRTKINITDNDVKIMKHNIG